MIIVMGEARLGEGEWERLESAMQTQVEATLKEEGCLHYSFSRDVCDPNLMRIAERWVDQAALDGHFVSPHMAAFNAAIGGAKVLGISVIAYENGSERVLMGG